MTAEVVPDDQVLVRRNAHGVVLALDLNTELLECVEDRVEIGLLDSVDRDVAARDRREPDEASDLDVIGSDVPFAAAQRLDPLDAQHVRLDPLDARTEGDEEAAEVLDVRLARRVAEDRLAGRQRGGHDGVLGRHDARLVEEDVLAVHDSAANLVAAADRDVRAELVERVDVGIEAPPADDVSAGGRHAHASDARE